MRALITVVVLLSIVIAGCFVDGKDILGPWDPRFQAVCIDSLYAEPDMVCDPSATVRITIPNPLYVPPADSVAP